MAGTRYTKQGVQQAVEGWEAPLNDDIDRILGPHPFAMPEVDTEGSLPAANINRNCWIMIQDYASTGKPAVAISDGVDWHIKTSWRSRHTLAADAANWDIVEAAIPAFDNFTARLWFEQKSGAAAALGIQLGDSGGMDGAAVYATERWGTFASAMGQTSSAGDVAILPLPAGFTSITGYHTVLNLTFQRLTSTSWAVLGETFVAVAGAGAGPWVTATGGGFRATYNGAKTVDRFRVNIGASIIDATRNGCEIRFN